MTYYADPGIKKIFSVSRTEPCVNEVFSVMTSIYPWASCGKSLRDAVCCTHVICVISFTLIKCQPSYMVERKFPQHTWIINDSVRVSTTLKRDLK